MLKIILFVIFICLEKLKHPKLEVRSFENSEKAAQKNASSENSSKDALFNSSNLTNYEGIFKTFLLYSFYVHSIILSKKSTEFST